FNLIGCKPDTANLHGHTRIESAAIQINDFSAFPVNVAAADFLQLRTRVIAVNKSGTVAAMQWCRINITDILADHQLIQRTVFQAEIWFDLNSAQTIADTDTETQRQRLPGTIEFYRIVIDRQFIYHTVNREAQRLGLHQRTAHGGELIHHNKQVVFNGRQLTAGAAWHDIVVWVFVGLAVGPQTINRTGINSRRLNHQTGGVASDCIVIIQRWLARKIPE